MLFEYSNIVEDFILTGSYPTTLVVEVE